MRALITGINGQIGSYLAELLLEKGYEVFGIIRRNSSAEAQTTRLDHILDKIHLSYADVTDFASLVKVIREVNPKEIYHLAAQSHVRVSFDLPVLTTNSNVLGTLNLLEVILKEGKDIRLYNAGSSEMFGNSVDPDGFQRESTPMIPVSPYGCSKLFTYNLCNNYRESYKMFISNGILFNTESPRRGSNFVTAKVVKGLVDIANKKQTSLTLGNLNSKRDWCHVRDSIFAMWLLLQGEVSDNYVIATGKSYSITDLVTYVSTKLNLENPEIIIDPKYFRPVELNYLRGDSSKIRDKLGWSPKYTFNDTIDEMIDYWRNV